MLPLALVVVILGGTGSLLGALVGSFIDRLPLQFRPGDVPRPRLRRSCSCRCCSCWCCGRRACSARWCRDAQLQRAAIARRARRAGDRCRSGSATVLHQHRQPDPALRGLRARRSTCWSATPGWSRSATPGCSASPPTPARMLLAAGYGHSLADRRRRSPSTLATAAVFAVLALRAHRPRLPDDHAGARPDPLGHRLSLGQPHQRRQRHQRGDAGRRRSASASPAPASFYCATLVVFLLRRRRRWLLFVRSPFGASLRGTRDQPRRMTALGYNVWLIRFLAFLFSGFWTGVGRAAVPLLQPVRQPAGGGAAPPRPRRC